MFQGHYFNGQFDYWPYQFVLTIGVFLYVYSSIISVYYLLPVDENKRKMVPFLMRGSSSGLREQVETFLSILGKFTQAFWDGLLLLLSLFCVLMATIYMASTERFGINKYPFDFYFTLSSFYDTFTKTDPVCIDNNPCSRIRSSLAMFYFALLFQFLSFQIAYSAYRHELKSRKGLASREDVQAGLGQMRPVPVSSSQGYDDLATV
ncbi:hypothetical protein EON65_27770 [archaeon]|nr:MAG: hypothetical protein EON65_27770 [archaeon]